MEIIDAMKESWEKATLKNVKIYFHVPRSISTISLKQVWHTGKNVKLHELIFRFTWVISRIYVQQVSGFIKHPERQAKIRYPSIFGKSYSNDVF